MPGDGLGSAVAAWRRRCAAGGRAGRVASPQQNAHARTPGAPRTVPGPRCGWGSCQCPGRRSSARRRSRRRELGSRRPACGVEASEKGGGEVGGGKDSAGMRAAATVRGLARGRRRGAGAAMTYHVGSRGMAGQPPHDPRRRGGARLRSGKVGAYLSQRHMECILSPASSETAAMVVQGSAGLARSACVLKFKADPSLPSRTARGGLQRLGGRTSVGNCSSELAPAGPRSGGENKLLVVFRQSIAHARWLGGRRAARRAKSGLSDVCQTVPLRSFDWRAR